MAWGAITNAEIDPDSPITTALKTKFRDNDEALYDGRYLIVKAAAEGPLGPGLQDDDVLLLPLLAGQIWHFEMILIVSTGGIGHQFDFDFTFPVGTTYMLAHNAHQGNAVLLSGLTTEASGATTVPYGVAAANDLVFFHGWVEAAAASGDFQLQWAASGGGETATVQANSYIAAYQDPSTM